MLVLLVCFTLQPLSCVLVLYGLLFFQLAPQLCLVPVPKFTAHLNPVGDCEDPGEGNCAEVNGLLSESEVFLNVW